METQVRNEIFRILETITGLDSGNVFYGQARQGATYPYCVFSQVSNPFSRDTVTGFETVYIQFSLYGTDVNGLEALEASLIEKFDDSELLFSLTDYSVRGIVRQFRAAEPVKYKVWHIVCRYRLELQNG